MSVIDAAHAAMEASPEDTSKRMKFYERVADSELFLVLEAEPSGDNAVPSLFEVEADTYALVFDSAERLTEFTQAPTPYLAASGRQITAMLAGQGIGLGVNLAVAPSSMLLPASAVEWLHQTLGAAPQAQQATPSAVYGPGSVPEALIAALDTKLASMSGLARCAYLAEMDYENRPRTHVLAFVDAVPAAEPAMAGAVSEALTFSGVEAGSLDVIFLAAQNPLSAALAKHGLRFDLPEPVAEPVRVVGAPGSDPDKPPILR